MEHSERILITGASGTLGSALLNSFKEHTLFGTYRKNPIAKENAEIFCVDLSDKSRTDALIRKIIPSIIIHTAALTNVDLCEADKDLAWTQNVLATENLLKSSPDSLFVYISSDGVFSGTKGNYKETDEPSPPNHYGKTKIEAEKAVQKISKNFIIIRTTFYGWNTIKKKNIIESIITNCKNKEETRMRSDQFFSPVSTYQLCGILKKLIERRAQGIFNISSARISKYEFGLTVAEAFGLEKSYIKPTTDNQRDTARRPKDISLNNQKLCSFLNIRAPNLKEGLTELEKHRPK
jgi:dTDP-4-dehydrorhamnose reductase